MKYSSFQQKARSINEALLKYKQPSYKNKPISTDAYPGIDNWGKHWLILVCFYMRVVLQ